MEIGNKILELRKQKGMSQEQLAEKMEVARQTISKWELGETSPDISQAKKLSTIFNVSLDELVNNDVKNVVVEKVSNIEKLAGMIIFIIKIGIGIFVGYIILIILACIFFTTSHTEVTSEDSVTKIISCTLNDEEYTFNIVYSQDSGTIYEYDGTDVESLIGNRKFLNTNELENFIEQTIEDKGGFCENE